MIRELVRRTGITADQIDDVVFGHCYPTMDAPAIGRVAALDAGLDVTVPGHPDRPALRVGSAGGALRGDGGLDRVNGTAR